MQLVTTQYWSSSGREQHHLTNGRDHDCDGELGGGYRIDMADLVAVRQQNSDNQLKGSPTCLFDLLPHFGFGLLARIKECRTHQAGVLQEGFHHALSHAVHNVGQRGSRGNLVSHLAEKFVLFEEILYANLAEQSIFVRKPPVYTSHRESGAFRNAGDGGRFQSVFVEDFPGRVDQSTH